MKAFKLTSLRDMSLVDAPDPTIRRPTDVLLKMGAVGVCGSDIHYYTTGRIGSQVVEYPFTVGHECAGTVLEVGEEVCHVRPGDRVAIEPAVTCKTCDQCLSGRENTCRNNRFLGCPGQADGSLSEHLVLPEENCFKFDDRLSLGEATVSEPLAIAIYSVRQSGLVPGAKIGILGLGPIGRTVHLAAIDAGCGPVYATDNIDDRCDAARARRFHLGRQSAAPTWCAKSSHSIPWALTSSSNAAASRQRSTTRSTCFARAARSS